MSESQFDFDRVLSENLLKFHMSAAKEHIRRAHQANNRVGYHLAVLHDSMLTPLEAAYAQQAIEEVLNEIPQQAK